MLLILLLLQVLVLVLLLLVLLVLPLLLFLLSSLLPTSARGLRICAAPFRRSLIVPSLKSKSEGRVTCAYSKPERSPPPRTRFDSDNSTQTFRRKRSMKRRAAHNVRASFPLRLRARLLWSGGMMRSSTTKTIRALNESAITHFVYHPVPTRSPTEKPPPPPRTVVLTKRERRKLRRRDRLEHNREAAEKIALGLLPPQTNKLRIGNLMNALLNESVADPSELERRVKADMAARKEHHDKMNAANTLSAADRWAKTKAKFAESVGAVEVALLRIPPFNAKVRFQMNANAEVWQIKGVVLILPAAAAVIKAQAEAAAALAAADRTTANTVSAPSGDAAVCLCVIEGGAVGVRKFIHFLSKRVSWSSTSGERNDDDADDDQRETDALAGDNGCTVVWRGAVAKHAFSRFGFELCRSQTHARSALAKFGVEHYYEQMSAQ